MDNKEFIRKKYLIKRKKNFINIENNYFNPLIKIIRKNNKYKKKYISLYYPSNFEVNILNILDIDFFKNSIFLLPIIEENGSMNFYKWKKNDILFVNKYGVLEPKKSIIKFPDIILVPLLAFDRSKNRIGYGKGFYDRYLNNSIKNNKKILSVGVAFSFQKYHKLPINKKDFRLDFIITEKGLVKWIY